jgi:hypothetical protein
LKFNDKSPNYFNAKIVFWIGGARVYRNVSIFLILVCDFLFYFLLLVFVRVFVCFEAAGTLIRAFLIWGSLDFGSFFFFFWWGKP